MSILHVRFRAESLAQNGEFYMHLPPKTPPFFMKDNPYYQRERKVMVLLHGYTGDATDWLYNSAAADLSMRYNLAIVMPNGGISFYLDRKPTGRQYAKFIGEELIDYLRETFGLAMTKEDTLIGGVSMGGFGALHTGLAYPERFSGVMALSSALIIHQLKEMKPDMPATMANYEYYVETFGDLLKAEDSDCNPEVLFKKNKEKGIANPKIYMACGAQDFLLEPNHQMRDFLKEEKADFTYEEEDGVHDWSFWTPHAYKGIEYLLKK